MIPAAALGRHQPGSSAVHRLDPRTKMLGLLLVSTSSFAAPAPASLAGLAAFLLFVHRMAGLAFRPLFAGLKGFLWLFLFTVLVQLLWSPGRALWRIELGPLSLTLTGEGLRRSVLIMLQLAIFVAAGNLLSATTSPTRLGAALGWFLAPLRRLGLPGSEAVLAFSIGMQFLPLLAEEASEVRDAQISRGIGHLDPNPLTRLRALASLFVPVVARAVRRSEELALAMVCRGYREERRRTSLHPLEFGRRDLIALAALAGVLAAVLVAR